jgi:hypothetical protein
MMSLKPNKCHNYFVLVACGPMLFPWLVPFKLSIQAYGNIDHAKLIINDNHK